MELQHDASRFCARAFGARAVFSRDPLWTVDAGENYDLLWSGSLLTHVDSDYWPPILAYFRDRLAPGGTVVFSTHGELPIALLAGEPTAVAKLGPLVGDYGLEGRGGTVAEVAKRTGFAFFRYPGAEDLPWGLSLSTPDWVRGTIATVGGLEFVRHVACGWFDHHDVWTCTRSAP
jgi:hypothetical protein